MSVDLSILSYLESNIKMQSIDSIRMATDIF